MRKKHTVTLDTTIWAILKELKRIKNKSIGEVIEEVVEKFIDTEYNPLYFYLKVKGPKVSDSENEKLEKILDSLTDDGWTVTSPMNYELLFTNRASKKMKSLPRGYKKRIKNAFSELVSSYKEEIKLDIKSLRGRYEDMYKIRVNDIDLIFFTSREDRTILVIDILSD